MPIKWMSYNGFHHKTIIHKSPFELLSNNNVIKKKIRKRKLAQDE